jgi:multiple sugar transport system permease protein
MALPTHTSGVPVALRRPRLHLSRGQKDALFALLLILPAFAILALVVFAPILNGIRVSFLDYTLATRNNPAWNNFANYTRLFKSGEIFVYFRNTFVFVFFVVFIQFILGLIVALLLNAQIVARSALRALYLLPWTIPSVVVALLWGWMLQPQYGILNFVLRQLEVIQGPLQWTQHPQLAMVSIILAATWRQAPMMIVMLLAGLQSIPHDLVEAAMIDGASATQLFRRITLPLLVPVISTTVLIAIINNFQMFTIIFNMTAGGPLNRTTTLSIATYAKGFTRFDMGAAAAIGVMWLVVLAGLTVLYNRYFERLNPNA